MFERLGRKIDDFIWEIKQLIRRKSKLYKMKAYYYTKRKIKNKEFKNDQHFDRFMGMMRQTKHLNERQIKEFAKLYIKMSGVNKNGS